MGVHKRNTTLSEEGSKVDVSSTFLPRLHQLLHSHRPALQGHNTAGYGHTPQSFLARATPKMQICNWKKIWVFKRKEGTCWKTPRTQSTFKGFLYEIRNKLGSFWMIPKTQNIGRAKQWEVKLAAFKAKSDVALWHSYVSTLLVMLTS